MIKKWKNISYRNLNCRKHGCQNCIQTIRFVSLFVVLFDQLSCACAFLAAFRHFFFLHFFVLFRQKTKKKFFLEFGVYNHEMQKMSNFVGSHFKNNSLRKKKIIIFQHFCVNPHKGRTKTLVEPPICAFLFFSLFALFLLSVCNGKPC